MTSIAVILLCKGTIIITIITIIIILLMLLGLDILFALKDCNNMDLIYHSHLKEDQGGVALPDQHAVGLLVSAAVSC